jgi:hypothetical protein
VNKAADDFIEVTANFRTVHVSTHPVTLSEFRVFLEDAGRKVPNGVRRAPASYAGGPEPVVGVTQVDATAYCEWVCKRGARTCRLPSTDELDALMPHTTVTQRHGEVPDAGFWPHEKGSLPEVRGGLKPVFLCEWTRDIEEETAARDPERVMALIFYPPWLREGNNPLHAHAALLANQSYSFVTFRASYEG